LNDGSPPLEQDYVLSEKNSEKPEHEIPDPDFVYQKQPPFRMSRPMQANDSHFPHSLSEGFDNDISRSSLPLDEVVTGF